MTQEAFPDWILRITEEIWEGRGLAARMADHYARDVIVRTPGGVSVGEPAATQATLQTLAEFPDRTLLGEDVIWTETPDGGAISSHRILSQATHAGGSFGPRSGRRLIWRAIADCWAKDGRIADEWLIRDNGAIVRQLGHEPEDWVRREIEGGRSFEPLTPRTDSVGPYEGAGEPGEWGAKHTDLLTRLMQADFSVIPTAWDRACVTSWPGGVTEHGHGGADRLWLALRAALPSAAFSVRHVIGGEDPLMPPRSAIRWSMDGRHDGWGAFGRPTGAEVHVMGISHAEFGPWGLRRDWTLFDETAVWAQIALASG